MQETQVQSLGWEDPLEKEMATHSSILAWRIPWTEQPGGLQSKGSQRVRPIEATEHANESWASKEPSNTTCLIYSKGSPRVPYTEPDDCYF